MLQLPLFKPEGKWRPIDVSKLPPWPELGRIGIDTETHDPDIKKLGPGVRRDGRVVGISFAVEDDGPGHYLPIDHAGGDNLDRNLVLDYLRDQAKHFKGTLVGANIGYDLDYLASLGIIFRQAKFIRDIQVADPLINEHHLSYSLQAIAERWGLPGKNEGLLQDTARSYGVDPKGGLWQLPARYVAPYAIRDAELPLAILRKQEKAIDDQELWNVFNLESRVTVALVKMTRVGVKIDEDRLSQVEQWCVGEERKALATVKHATGHDIGLGNVWKAKALVPALQHIGCPLGYTPTGKPKVDKLSLDNIDHPVAEAILWARKVNKLRTTFAKSIRVHMINGRIHCGYNQIAREDEDSGGIKGAKYGRLSSEHPNMQQQPARDEFSKMWRSIYVPDTDDWATLDYSQQEPRVLTHFAVLAECSKAQEAARRYRNDPNTDNHQLMTELIYGDDVSTKENFKQLRTYAKQIYLGLCYGMGGAKLARSLGMDTKYITIREGTPQERRIEVAGDEAQDILDKFNKHAPFVLELANRAEEVAKKRGYILTLSGRRCRFPQDNAGNYDWCHKAMNRLIQGSSADQTKTAMVMASEAGYRLQLQVHDELDLSVTSLKQAEEVAEIMRNCIKLQVPSKVDVELGPNWGEIEDPYKEVA